MTMKASVGSPEQLLEGEVLFSMDASTERRWKIAWCHTGDSGGSKRAAYEMVRELARRGHVIDEYILRIGEPNLAHWPLQPHVRESYRYVLPQTGSRLRPYIVQAWCELLQNLSTHRALMSTFKMVAGDLDARGYDFVHLDHCSPSYTIALSSMIALPSVVYSHEVSGARYVTAEDGQASVQSSLLKRIYERGCGMATGTWSRIKEEEDLKGLRAADLVLTNSCYSKEALFQRARRDSVVCRYGVNTTVFRPLGLEVEPLVLSAGRIVKAKQHHAVIEAVANLPASERPRVVIATPESLSHQEDPAYFAKVTGMARAAGVALEIVRKPSEEELVELYNRALLLVFVPLMEPFGLVALEAMACGTPIVGVREAGVRESVIDGVCGLLVERDARDITSAIDRLSKDRELRERLGQQASAYVRREWTWTRSIDCYERQLRRLLLASAEKKRQASASREGEAL